MSIEKTPAQDLTPQTVNQQDEQGNTPLHHAVLNGSSTYYKLKPNFEQIEKLLSLGADITLKNKLGLSANNLIFGETYNGQCRRIIKEGTTTEMLERRHTYTNLVITYQPTAENLQCLLESEVLHPANVPVSQLSQDCLEKLILWCQQGVKTYKSTVITTPDGDFIITNVPQHLQFIGSIEGLAKNCQKELELLQKYPNLNEALEEIVKPGYREGILVALMQDKTIKDHFDTLVNQLDQLPLANELKIKVQELNQKLQARVKKNYPQLTCLNEEGKVLVDSLFGELYEAFHLRQMHFDTQSATTSNRWKDPNSEFAIQRAKEHQSEHQNSYQPVLTQLTSYQPNSTASTSSTSSSALSSTQSPIEAQLQPSREEMREKCAQASEKRFSS